MVICLAINTTSPNSLHLTEFSQTLGGAHFPRKHTYTYIHTHTHTYTHKHTRTHAPSIANVGLGCVYRRLAFVEYPPGFFALFWMLASNIRILNEVNTFLDEHSYALQSTGGMQPPILFFLLLTLVS